MARTYAQTFEWRFACPPEAIWPALADTARFNEAAGLPKHAIDEVLQDDGSVRFFAAARVGPFKIAWEEIPVEWVDREWFRHLRVFSKGPIARLCATLTLEPDGEGGCVGHYLLEVEPANLLGHAILSTRFFPSTERNFTKLAQGAEAWALGRQPRPYPPASHGLSDGARARLETVLQRIEDSPNGHGLARRLADWMLAAQQVDLMRMQPLALARAWQADERKVVEMCLQAVRDGLLELRWDLLCPRCRGAKLSAQALDRLPREAHCGSCNIDYGGDFERNIELTFRPAPSIYEVVDGEFCLFGPMTTDHVKLQVTLGAGEERTLPARLGAGSYRLRSLEAGGSCDVEVDEKGFPEVRIAGDAVTAGPPGTPGLVRLVNAGDSRRTFIVESRAWQRDALTAYRVTTMQAFRDLFADQILEPGGEVAISQVTLLFTDLKGSTAFYESVGDAVAYDAVRRHFAILAGVVRRHNGAVIKTIGDAVMAAFADPADGLRGALAMQQAIADFNRQAPPGEDGLVLKVGLHAGPCIAVTLNDRLDYFGGTVNMAARLQGESIGNDIVISDSLAEDPLVAPLLPPYKPTVESRPIRGFAEAVSFQRLVL